MMRRWAGPVVLAVVLAVVTYFVTLSRTPQMLMSAAVSRMAELGMNGFGHMPLATDKSRAVVRPSPDLAYSSCAFDLSKGPLAISVAPVPANYWSLSVFQANTDVAFIRNNVENGGKSMRVVVAQEGQVVPAGAEVVRVKGARGVALIRILVDDPARFPAIDAARRGSTCRILGAGA
ncbi:DUF1254 domain-containing protein [Sphingomonas sp. CL5.1]|uniref:DUF1254 domain-containing protein n=1 Tax=Sphingomonas sp. CL5.1 TaxID=2653203 RepID=UPI001583146F|nr:DUF1254 domain-containing protein [Sphingomonas sp. CL5.1]QKS01765.1 DUF1254 domain-containing protein [Sphingomonas sp. CL5.1]